MLRLDGLRDPGQKAAKRSKRSSIIHTMLMRQPAEAVLSKISSFISWTFGSPNKMIGLILC